MELHHSTLRLEEGFRVGVTSVGAGTPLVFLHGLSLSTRAYEELLIALAGQGFRVIGLDAADHGRTDSLPWGHSVSDMAEVTARTLTALGVDEAVMVGHSMGGGMVVEFAARYPARTAAAILVNAAAGAEHHAGLRMRPCTTVACWAGMKLARAALDVVNDGRHAARLRSGAAQRGLVATLRSSFSGLRCLRAARALMKADTVPLLQRLHANGVPTAVIHGELDKIVPFRAGAGAARTAGARLYLVSGAFHSWLLADPERAGRMICTAFWESLVSDRFAALASPLPA